MTFPRTLSRRTSSSDASQSSSCKLARAKKKEIPPKLRVDQSSSSTARIFSPYVSLSASENSLFFFSLCVLPRRLSAYGQRVFLSCFARNAVKGMCGKNEKNEDAFHQSIGRTKLHFSQVAVLEGIFRAS